MPFSLGGAVSDAFGSHSDVGPHAGYTADDAAKARAQADAAAQQAQNRGPVQADMSQAGQWYAASGQDSARSQAAGDQQRQALAMQQQAAMGQAPSAAQLQMQQGTDASIRAGMSMAAAARGGGFAQSAANLNAANNAAQLQQQNVQQQGIQRAQEMAQARGAYEQGTNDLRQSEQTERGMTIGVGNQMAQQALAQGQLALGSRQANDAYSLGQQNLGQGYTQIAQQGDIGYMNAVSQNNQANASMNQQNGMLGVGMLAGAFASDARAKTDIMPLDNSNAYNAPSSFNQSMDDEYKEAFGQNQSLAQQTAAMGSAAPPKPQSSGGGGSSSFSSGMELGGALAAMSDRNAKTGIRAADTPVDDFLDAIHPVSFRYKDPADGQGQRVGIIAQDAARTPVGQTMIRQTPRGLAIDGPAGLSTAFASLAAIDDRLRELEAGKGKTTLGPKGRKGGE